MTKYTCPECGKKHTIYSGLKAPEPEEIRNAPDESTKRFDEFVVIENKTVFLPGDININVTGQPEPFFRWSIWVKVELSEMLNKSDRIRADEVVPLQGFFYSQLPFYPEMMGSDIACSITLDPLSMAPETVEVLDAGQLKTDQDTPISLERMMEIMNVVHHGLPTTKKEAFEEPFAERLSAELARIRAVFLDEGKIFGMNLVTDSAAPLQIVSSSILEDNSGEAGFGIHLPLDLSFPEHEPVLARFKQLSIAGEFALHHWDGIPTYQLDCRLDLEKLVAYATLILEDCFGEDVETVGFDVFEI